MSEVPSAAVLARSLGRLKKERLAEECTVRLPAPEGEGRSDWGKKSKRDLVEALIASLPHTDLLDIAVAGVARYRSPGANGFIWRLAGGPKTNLDFGPLLTVSEDDLGGELKLPQVAALPAPDGTVARLFEIRYVVEEWGSSPNGEFVVIQQPRLANIVLDPENNVMTVFASAAGAAGLIAQAVAHKLALAPTPLRLAEIQIPDALDAKFAPSALQIIELVYGRFAEIGDILYASRIWTRPVAAGALATERSARGDGVDMLNDPDVRRDLARGDEIRGIYFVMRQRLGAGDPPAPMALPVTVRVDADLGMSLSIARGNYDESRVLLMYEDLRSRMMRSEASDGHGVRAVIARIRGQGNVA